MMPLINLPLIHKLPAYGPIHEQPFVGSDRRDPHGVTLSKHTSGLVLSRTQKTTACAIISATA